MCIVSNTYRIGKVRIEYVSYLQGPYRIRIVSAADRIEYVSYRQGPYRIHIVSAADRIEYVSYRQGPYRIRIVSSADRIEYVSYRLLTVSSQSYSETTGGIN